MCPKKNSYSLVAGVFGRALTVGLVAVALAFSGPAAADSFQGSVWSLTNNGLQPDADPLHETYRITLAVDTNLYTGGGSFLDQVGLKVSSALTGASLFDAPGGASSWSVVLGGINADGCQENANNGFSCANSTSILNGGKGVVVTTGNGPGIDYSWTFDLTMDNGTLFTATIGEDSPSVKARFVDYQGAKIGDLVSEHVPFTTTIPEPEIYAMLAAGLGLMGFVARRRRQHATAT